MTGPEPDDPHAAAARIDPADLVRIGLVALAAVVTWLWPWRPIAGVDVVALAATLVGGLPIFREAVGALLHRRMTMELSMTIALAAALAIGEYFTALVIVLFVLIAEVLEHLTIDRGRGAIRDLLAFLPRHATVSRAGTTYEVEIEEIRSDDVVIVRPGGRIPVDGVVVAGHSFVDQATVTGESLPAEKVAGSPVYAGTVNHAGVLEVEVHARGRDTAFGKIIEAVERAEASRAPIQKLSDQIAGYLVYTALGAAGLTFLLTRDVHATISVVIVAGACGVAAGTPLAILGAIGQAARRGAIVKGGLYVERLAKVDTIVLDKTGTLTSGTPAVSRLQPAPGVGETELLQAAAIAELHSEHPLGKAIVEEACRRGIEVVPPDAFAYVPGLGINGTIDGEEIVVGNATWLRQRSIGHDVAASGGLDGSQVLVARGGRFLGVVEITDGVRHDALAAVTAFRRLGLRTILLTGDSEPIAQAVGQHLGVDVVAAGLLPQDKAARVQALSASGSNVAMVGDGVNDAPALVHAAVGIAMGSGTDVARESADVMLIGNDLMALVDTLAIARRCRRIILANVAGTLAVDGIGMGVAAAGWLDPLAAAFVHVSSELAFILNSARLLRHRVAGRPR